MITALFAAALAFAGPVDPVNTGSKGIAVEGYDPVAYFTAGEPTKGDARFQHRYQNATYQFATADNLAAFQRDPAKYVPQYGGYCAYAVSQGHTAGISPKAWKIVDGKLYLNHRFAKGKFEKDVPGAIAAADRNWPRIPKKTAGQ